MKDTSNTQNRSNRQLYFRLILTTVILLGGCIACYYYLNHTAERTLEYLPTLEESVHQADWEAAEATYDDAYAYWSKHSKILLCFLTHDEIDDIESKLLELSGYLDAQASNESIGCIYTLRYKLSHISETEQFAIYNIL